MTKADDSIHERLTDLHGRIDFTQLATPKKPVCELGLRLTLRGAGMRLERRGYGFRLLFGNQVLAGGEFEMSLDEVAGFTNRALNREAVR